MRTALFLLCLLPILSGLFTLPAAAQSYQGEEPLQGMAQIDITGGLADRSAHYAMQQVNPGYVQTMQAPITQQAAPMNAMAQPYGGRTSYAQPQQQCNIGAQYGYVPVQQAQAQWAQPPQQQQQAPPAQQASPGNPRLMTQMMGALGAATMFSVLSNGGMDSILSPLSRGRGFNNRFQTYGSCIGGNVSF
ncbi:MAG: hypothetical protein K2W95_21160 [Candidatus Obscuribacterales bacterium]|nr:hypothetical protein [Candidatus Obscuribacterales bacterium]